VERHPFVYLLHCGLERLQAYINFLSDIVFHAACEYPSWESRPAVLDIGKGLPNHALRHFGGDKVIKPLGMLVPEFVVNVLSYKVGFFLWLIEVRELTEVGLVFGFDLFLFKVSVNVNVILCILFNCILYGRFFYQALGKNFCLPW
jgi:hypothetical protein